MYLNTKKAIRNNGVITVRIKSLNWQGTRYGLEVDGQIVEIATYETIMEMYEKY